jgi:hypothetical protein
VTHPPFFFAGPDEGPVMSDDDEVGFARPKLGEGIKRVLADPPGF